MGQKSLIESKGACAFALRLFVAANCAALRLLSSVHAQVQVQREATVIPSRVETRKNSNLDTSVTAAHDDNGGLTYVRSPRKAKSMRITSWRAGVSRSIPGVFVEPTGSHPAGEAGSRHGVCVLAPAASTALVEFKS